MAGKPLVSVIVATHNRQSELLERCLPSIAAQDHPNIELVVVSDGPDTAWKDVERLPEGWGKFGELAIREAVPHFEKIQYLETGRNWHSLSGLSWGCEPRTLGAFAARGDYLCYVDDDDTITTDHVSTLVAALDGTQHWFAICQYQYPDGRVLGDGKVEANHLGTCSIMFRPECLCASVLRPGSYHGDFEWIQRMAQTGMSFTFVPKATYLVGHNLEELGTK